LLTDGTEHRIKVMFDVGVIQVFYHMSTRPKMSKARSVGRECSFLILATMNFVHYVQF